MHIVSLEAIPYSIPYRRPLAFAIGEVREAAHVLLRIRTDDGIVGQADVLPRPYTYGETVGSILAAVHTLFAPVLVGRDPGNREMIDRLLDNTVANNTVKAAVDLALWDILGQELGVSCHRLLGGYTDRVRVSHMVGIGKPAEMAEEARWVHDDFGVTTFKVKVGRPEYRTDVEAVLRIRDALGDDVVLGLDANHGWTAEQATAALTAMEPAGVELIEEPCPSSEVLGRRRCIAGTRIPVYADESAPTLETAARAVTTDGFDGINIKTSRSGFTRSSRILGLCDGLGIGVLVGNQIDTQLGTLASVAFAAAHRHTAVRPAEVTNFLLIEDDLLTDPVRVVDGAIAVRPGPGLGIEIDEDKLAYYRADL